MGKMKTRRRARTSRKRVGDVNMVSDKSADYLVGKDTVDENGQARKNAWVWDEDK